MGYVPREYSNMRAARYLGVPPWDLEQQSSYWTEHALAFEEIEVAAQRKAREKKERHSTRRKKRR